MKSRYLISRLLTSLSPFFLLFFLSTPANGFDVDKGGGKDCSACHTINLEEATRLLKDIVKSVDSIGYANVPGLFTASVTGKDGRNGLIYIDFSKTYIISGVTVRISDRQNVSKMEMMDIVRVDTSTIPKADSVILGNPEASKVVYLFTDPECPFCKKLHPELLKAIKIDNDIVFYIKMLPLVNLHPDAYRISKAIICDGSVKLLEDSFAGRKIPEPTCETDAVDRTIQLARELGIGSTPTLVLPDGRLAPGYRTAEKIVELVNGK